jgi:hypothetical protein
MVDDHEVTLEFVAGEFGGSGGLYEGESHLCAWELTTVDDLGYDRLEFALEATSQEVECIRHSTLFLTADSEGTLDLYWEGTQWTGDSFSGHATLTHQD